MKRYLVLPLICALVAICGCKAKHPSVVKMDPDFEPGLVNSIMTVPVFTSITGEQEMIRECERTSNRILRDALRERTEYNFLSPEQFRIAMSQAGILDKYANFKRLWTTDKGGSRESIEFLRAIKSVRNIDLMLIFHVYLWNKDEADYREVGTASCTQVGAEMFLVEPATGKVVWEAVDENFKEAVRTEGERVTAAYGGHDRRIRGKTETGSDMYAAPPFDDVADLVIRVLVDALPGKGSI